VSGYYRRNESFLSFFVLHPEPTPHVGAQQDDHVTLLHVQCTFFCTEVIAVDDQQGLTQAFASFGRRCRPQIQSVDASFSTCTDGVPRPATVTSYLPAAFRFRTELLGVGHVSGGFWKHVRAFLPTGGGNVIVGRRDYSWNKLKSNSTKPCFYA
jgi:hypothetical protein